MTLINFALALIHVEIYYSEFYSNDNLMPVRVRLRTTGGDRKLDRRVQSPFLGH